MSLIDRAVFGMIYDRWRLSSYNAAGSDGDKPQWYDAGVDDYYCVFAHDELARLIGVSEKTIRRSLTVLHDLGFIYWRKREYMGANRYFIGGQMQHYMSTLRQHSKDGTDCP